MNRKFRISAGIAAVAIAGGLITKSLLPPPQAAVPTHVQPGGDPGRFDHRHLAFDEILKARVIAGRVDYRALQADRKGLDNYLDELAAVTRAEFERWHRDQQLAMLINLYNAAALQLIIDHYPVDSIKDIGGLFRQPWDLKRLDLFGRAMSLGDIEHGLLREDYAEPRIHFAIVCAAKGCPDLRRGAFTAENLGHQLDEQGQAFLRDREKNRIDAASRTLYLSKIFKWFKRDFEAAGGVIEVAKTFSEPDLARLLEDDFKIKYTEYDWSLNER